MGLTAIKLLFNSFFKHISHYEAQLPYNLNWGLENSKPFEMFLENHFLVIADIGARGGNINEIENLKKFIKYYAFDADFEEVKKLKENPPIGFKKFEIFPYYIGDKEGLMDFNIFKNKSQSSSLQPNLRYKTIFGGEDFGVEKQITVESITLDKIIEINKLEYPDLIKIDTQGTEFNILMNSRESISQSLLLEIEVEFVETYQGQPLFPEVCRFMFDNGYELLYLNRAFGNRINYKGIARGQITHGDALFGRREDKLENFGLDKIAKYIILLINYGHLDFAYNLCEQYPGIKKYIPDIESSFIFENRGKFSLLKKGLLMQLDKIICLLLYLRKTNQLKGDSDRSYPLR